MSVDDDFAGHSKAPWHYSPTHYGKAFDIGAADGDNVALVYGPEENGSDFFRANARLIAAAPSLLAETQRLRAQVAGLREAASDALSGWRYIRQQHGDLYGVGWDRVEAALVAALASAEDRT